MARWRKGGPWKGHWVGHRGDPDMKVSRMVGVEALKARIKEWQVSRRKKKFSWFPWEHISPPITVGGAFRGKQIWMEKAVAGPTREAQEASVIKVVAWRATWEERAINCPNMRITLTPHNHLKAYVTWHFTKQREDPPLPGTEISGQKSQDRYICEGYRFIFNHLIKNTWVRILACRPRGVLEYYLIEPWHYRIRNWGSGQVT